ncbi:outer membrane protein OmpK [Photobacterium rosenbergii]|uniref:Outer membrane protein OmpK n=1 Tax=Photobacterium rosenbergii TaxID=294936 RepID=A0ABU3ZM72_9GAMM|nr:outer membrane protein OmpK [Photobacterium rosenbergii]MDV5171214.1 outer membrane protein OmpK [Photobacterium rosenbergii]
MYKTLTALSITAALILPTTSFAIDYSDDIHKNDYKWLQFNLMYALEELPRSPDARSGHDYLEMEFGGRSGIFDLYGYVDVFDLTDHDASDKQDGVKIFMKFAPRLSLDAMTKKDLSIGPFQEFYIATLFNWDGGYSKESDFPPVNNSFWGIGSDVQVPWFGKVGLNLYGLYDINNKDWNGLQISTNWFKPFYTFSNDSFIAYQGYIDYQFAADDTFKGNSQANDGGVMFNGFYWHSDRYAVGYGFKLFYDVYLIEDTNDFESTGISHYFSVTYKF